ncbi:MAG: esterase-like activity of phytase family protein [Acetobacteraceae bacterium]|nr:esterase-like activity of phytase family protein [Acetobacteraceae bacterium]
MRPLPTAFAVITGVLLLVPGWSGEQRLVLLRPEPVTRATRVALDLSDPGRRRVGALTYLGGVRLESPDPAFGGFSSLIVVGDRVTVLSDGGNLVSFQLHGDGRVDQARFGELPSGPGTGWAKLDRDSESMTADARTGATWVGFEHWNALWRYAPGFARAERGVRPAAMRRWRSNGGPESFTRLRDGRFVVIAEEGTHGPGRETLVFSRDPTLDGRPAFRFRYLPPAGFDPSDLCELPDGRLLVLNRWWGLPLRFVSSLVVIDPRALRAGALVGGREIARLGPPLQHENFEGVTATVEGGRTVLWLVNDNDRMPWRPSLLLKFRLD